MKPDSSMNSYCLSKEAKGQERAVLEHARKHANCSKASCQLPACKLQAHCHNIQQRAWLLDHKPVLRPKHVSSYRGVYSIELAHPLVIHAIVLYPAGFARVMLQHPDLLFLSCCLSLPSLLQLAVKVARLACESQPLSAEVWMHRLDLEQQQATSSSSSSGGGGGGRKSHAKFWEVALEGLQTVPWQHRPPLWLKVGHRMYKL